VERERGKGREKSIPPLPLHEGSLIEFPMLSGGESERKKGKEESCPFGERKMRTFSCGVYLCILKASI
jgi:hypothetical protein